MDFGARPACFSLLGIGRRALYLIIPYGLRDSYILTIFCISYIINFGSMGNNTQYTVKSQKVSCEISNYRDPITAL